MRIGQLATRSGVTAKTIRFWEAEGLLPDPVRTPSGYRDYDSGALERLSFIRRAQTAGLRLAEIRQVLEISDAGQPACGHVTDLVHQHLTELEERIRELQETRSLLEHLAERAGAQDPADCDGYCAILEHPGPPEVSRAAAVAEP